ncbi:MAG TPA: hypothetical protein VKA26_00565 [Ignavibacteriaceae bacterium]|nr:hypothetical protein [Ignavibacteriaceae bacterium]
MKKFIILFFCLFSVLSYSQQLFQTQLDSIYTRFISERGIKNIVSAAPGADFDTDTTKIKCGFGITSQVRFLFNEFSQQQQIELSKLLQRPSSDSSIVSPKGYFRLHFFKSGASSPTYDVDLAAVAADSAWDFEINYLGYPAPPSDNGEGGDDKYDIYIDNLGTVYAQTTPENEISPNSSKYDSYLEVNNDFTGFYTTGLDAFRVSVAHEFHHAIQVGNYIFKQDSFGNILDQYFYELTSTSMEIFVFNTIPDYVGYLASYFNNPGKGFGLHSGYDLAIWNLYLKMNFGYNIIKRQWQLFITSSALNSINSSLVESGSNFGKEYRGFGVWCYYTNYRSSSGKYFPLSPNYPVIHSVSSIIFSPPLDSVKVNANPASNNYITFANASDTLVTVITNTNYQSGIDNPGSTLRFTYILYNDPNIGIRKLSSNYSADLNVTKSEDWRGSEILNGQIVNTDTNQVITAPVELAYAYPQPFFYKQGVNLIIPAPLDNNGTADLNIYSASLDLKYSSQLQIYYLSGKPVVSWSGKSLNNSRLASGVYIYFTKSGDEVLKGKLVIFNE